MAFSDLLSSVLNNRKLLNTGTNISTGGINPNAPGPGQMGTYNYPYSNQYIAQQQALAQQRAYQQAMAQRQQMAYQQAMAQRQAQMAAQQNAYQRQLAQQQAQQRAYQQAMAQRQPTGTSVVDNVLDRAGQGVIKGALNGLMSGNVLGGAINGLAGGAMSGALGPLAGMLGGSGFNPYAGGGQSNMMGMTPGNFFNFANAAVLREQAARNAATSAKNAQEAYQGRVNQAKNAANSALKNAAEYKNMTAADKALAQQGANLVADGTFNWNNAKTDNGYDMVNAAQMRAAIDEQIPDEYLNYLSDGKNLSNMSYDQLMDVLTKPGMKSEDVQAYYDKKNAAERDKNIAQNSAFLQSIGINPAVWDQNKLGLIDPNSFKEEVKKVYGDQPKTQQQMIQELGSSFNPNADLQKQYYDYRVKKTDEDAAKKKASDELSAKYARQNDPSFQQWIDYYNKWGDESTKQYLKDNYGYDIDKERSSTTQYQSDGTPKIKGEVVPPKEFDYAKFLKAQEEGAAELKRKQEEYNAAKDDQKTSNKLIAASKSQYDLAKMGYEGNYQDYQKYMAAGDVVKAQNSLNEANKYAEQANKIRNDLSSNKWAKGPSLDGMYNEKFGLSNEEKQMLDANSPAYQNLLNTVIKPKTQAQQDAEKLDEGNRSALASSLASRADFKARLRPDEDVNNMSQQQMMDVLMRSPYVAPKTEVQPTQEQTQPYSNLMSSVIPQNNKQVVMSSTTQGTGEGPLTKKYREEMEDFKGRGWPKETWAESERLYNYYKGKNM